MTIAFHWVNHQSSRIDRFYLKMYFHQSISAIKIPYTISLQYVNFIILTYAKLMKYWSCNVSHRMNIAFNRLYSPTEHALWGELSKIQVTNFKLKNPWKNYFLFHKINTTLTNIFPMYLIWTSSIMRYNLG